jgi:hypothetical protein
VVIVRVGRVCVVGDRVGLIFRMEFVLVDIVLVEFVLVDIVLVDFVLVDFVRVEFNRLFVYGGRGLFVHGGGGLGKLRRFCRLDHLRCQRAGLGGGRRRSLLAGLESLRRDHVMTLGRQELLPRPGLLASQRSAGATESTIGGVVTVGRAHCSLPFLC